MQDAIQQRQSKILDELLNAEEVGTPNYAMITHSYAMLSRYLKREDDAEKYLMMSAIAVFRMPHVKRPPCRHLH